MYKEGFVGGIVNSLKGVDVNNFEISNGSFTFKVTSLIYPNGKIAFYYDNVGKEFQEDDVDSRFGGPIKCGKNGDYKSAQVKVPKKWIQSGTLVELEVLADCPKHNSINTCEDAKTPDKTCIWCEKSEMCTASNDKYNHEFKVNGCQVEVSNW
ncbi:unnamed protein product [Schistosoma rodhaini]|nr:unnamed protein product [Schistosoma rodhaini]